jgi:hypothetical protein
MTELRNPYQYMVSMLCRVYWEPYASKSPLSYMSLIHYYAEKGLPFNKDNIISTNLIKSITTVIEA